MRRANTFDIRPLSHCERLALIELLDSSAACINEINYDRRQAYFEARYDLPDGYTVCKLPRPTRSLPPCGGWSLLEGGAFPHRNCAPRPPAWTRPGFLLSFHGTGSVSAGRSTAPTRRLHRGTARGSWAAPMSFERRFAPFVMTRERRSLEPHGVAGHNCVAGKPRPQGVTNRRKAGGSE